MQKVKIYPVINGNCSCDDLTCDKQGKHIVPDIMADVVKTKSYAIYTDGLLVVDYKDPIEESKYVVQTGSCGYHSYFKIEDGDYVSYNGEMRFISGKGNVVVCEGSEHQSGVKYKCVKGNIEDVNEPPERIKSMLTRKSFSKAGDTVIHDHDIEKAIKNIKYNKGIDYEVGCSLYAHYSGSEKGFKLWEKFTNRKCSHFTYQSFYKYKNFFSGKNILSLRDGKTKIELCGLAKEIKEYVEETAIKEVSNLSTLASLQILSNIFCPLFKSSEGLHLNLYTFGVCPSSGGKSHIQSMINNFTVEFFGIKYVTNASIRSAQEIIKNAINTTLGCYVIDEFGMELEKIYDRNSDNYTKDIQKILLTAYTLGDQELPIYGDTLREIIKELEKKVKEISMLIDRNIEVDINRENLHIVKRKIETLKKEGIRDRMITISGFTTPETFVHLCNENLANNGFFGRAFIFEDTESIKPIRWNRNKSISRKNIIEKMKSYSDSFLYEDVMGCVELFGDKKEIPFSDDAKQKLLECEEYFINLALIERERERGGLESLLGRCIENIIKVSTLLSIGDSKEVEPKHVMIAFDIVREDVNKKLNLVRSNLTISTIEDKILSRIPDDGWTVSVASNRLRIDKNKISKILNCMKEKSMLKLINNKYFKVA